MKICYHQDPVPEGPVIANTGLKILFHFRIYLPMHGLEQHSVLSSLNREVKTPQSFVSSSDMFLDKKTLLKIRVNPGLNHLSRNWAQGYDAIGVVITTKDAITYFTCSLISQHWEPFFQNRLRKLFPPIAATIDVG